MKKRILAVIFAALTGFGATTYAQSGLPGMDTYNVQRAIEAVGNDDYDTAKSYFQKEVDENPKNGVGYLGLASMYSDEGLYEEAIKMCERGIKASKSKNKMCAALLCNELADIYQNLEQTDKALKAFAQAMKLDPSDPDYVYGYIDILENEERYAEQASAIKLLEKKFADNPVACVYVGRYYRDIKDNQKALLAYSRSIILSSEEYSTPYAFRAEALMEMEEWREAAEDIVKAIAIDNDGKAVREMGQMAEKAYDEMLAALQRKAESDVENPYWPYLMADLSNDAKRYDDALTYYAKALPLTSNDDEDAAVSTTDVLSSRSMCYQSLHRLAEALADVDKVLEVDNDNFLAHMERMDICYELSDPDGAYAEASYLIEELPWYSGIYVMRAGYSMAKDDFVKAIEDLDTALAVDDTDASALQRRATSYGMLGRKNDAQKDLQTILALDDDEVNGAKDAKCFAYATLGERDKALALCDELYDEEEPENLYNRACIRCILGDNDAALDLLEKSFEKGYINTGHTGYDCDLRPLHGNPRFEKLLKDHAPIPAPQN